MAMPSFDVDVDFVFNAVVRVEAPDAATAEAMVLNANNDQVAHLNGKSYALADETTRVVNFITEVV